jgi:adenosylcobinamide kinase/adenosylcobinamide-phosphate guanylyltransferase
MTPRLTFVLGGARSGKTRYAQELAAALGGRVTYVATGEAGDDEMRERIAAHRADRPAEWQTMERPMRLGDALTEWDADVVVVDCLTLLVSNLLMHIGEDAPAGMLDIRVGEEIDELLAAWRGAEYHLIVVSNEVGMGLVPPYPQGRIYRDALGRANQRMAQAASEVILMVAGIGWKLKGAHD